MSDMITMHMPIEITEGISDAPNYGTDTTMVKVTKALVVPKGTQEGNPTIDLQLEDAAGNKYLIMTTGNLIECLAGAAKGVRMRGAN